jgi:hypothetical protein
MESMTRDNDTRAFEASRYPVEMAGPESLWELRLEDWLRAQDPIECIAIQTRSPGTTGTSSGVGAAGFSVLLLREDTDNALIQSFCGTLPGSAKERHEPYPVESLTFAREDKPARPKAQLKPVVSWAECLQANRKLASDIDAERRAEIAARFADELERLKTSESF